LETLTEKSKQHEKIVLELLEQENKLIREIERLSRKHEMIWAITEAKMLPFGRQVFLERGERFDMISDEMIKKASPNKIRELIWG